MNAFALCVPLVFQPPVGIVIRPSLWRMTRGLCATSRMNPSGSTKQTDEPTGFVPRLPSARACMGATRGHPGRIGRLPVFEAHDQLRARIRTDRCIVGHAGRIEQIGVQDEVFRISRSSCHCERHVDEARLSPRGTVPPQRWR